MKKSIKRIIISCTLCTLSLISFPLVSNASVGQTVFTNQVTTADSQPTGAKGANEQVMKVGYCAVHPQVSGQHQNSIFSFGTILYIDAFDGEAGAPIPHPNGELYTLQVQDIGDVAYARPKYWVDIYWGPKETMYQSALNYGKSHTISYTSSTGAKK